MKMRRAWLGIAFLGGSVLLAGCGKDEAAGAADVLAYVPADTPYVFANTSPLPEAVLTAWGEKFYGPAFEAWNHLLEEAAKKNPTLGDESKVGKAVIDEVRGRTTRAQWAEVGLKPDAHFALYGLGLAPVWRLELADPQKFQAMLDRVQQKSGEKFVTETVGGQSYYRFGSDKVQGLLAIQGPHLVVSLLPQNASEAIKRQILGVDKPAKTIGDAGTLAALNEKYGFTPHGTGFIDLQQSLALALTQTHPVQKEFMTALQIPAADLSPACQTEIKGIVARFPRVALGYTEIAGNRMHTLAVIETEAALAKELAGLSAPIAGLESGADAMMQFGFGFDPGKALVFLKAQAARVAAAPYQCEQLADWNTGFAEMAANLDNPMTPMISQIKGVVFSLSDFSMEGGAAPKDMAGRVIVTTDNPLALLGLAQSGAPQLAQLKIPETGEPVELPADLLPLGTGKKAYVAMGPKAVGVALGDAEMAMLKPAVTTVPNGPGPLLSFSYGGRFFEVITKQMEASVQTEIDPEKKAEAQWAVDFNKRFMQAFKYTRTDVRFTERGIEFVQVMEMR